MVDDPAKRIFGPVAVKASTRKSRRARADNPPQMHSFWIRPETLGILVAVLALGGAAGCSKGSGCDSSQCAANNQCIDDGTGGGATCRRVCASQMDCPANYYCNDGLGGMGVGPSWCVKFTPQNGTGQFGSGCAASKGEGANPDCDWNHGFACYGTGTTDPYSFCTQFACSSDSECPPTWWCATQNYGPNVTSDAPTYGRTRTVCLPRTAAGDSTYPNLPCSPCKKDFDCYSGGTPVSCVPGSDGTSFCAKQCSGNSNCPVDAVCAPPWKVCAVSGDAGQCSHDDQCPPANGTFQHCVGGTCTPECASATDCPGGEKCVDGTSVCRPRAGVCVGDGSFCAPCRSDDDCAPAPGSLSASEAHGYCFLRNSDGLERFCSAPATVAACDGGFNPPSCPAATSADNWQATICTGSASGVPPTNQCIGLVTFPPPGTYIAGCWTQNR